MSELLLQVLIVVAFGAFCFGCGYLTAAMRSVARYDRQTGKWGWGKPPKERTVEIPRGFPPPWSVEEAAACYQNACLW
jgi:hypothetical protein